MYAIIVSDANGKFRLAELHLHKDVAEACAKEYTRWQTAQVVGPWQSVRLEHLCTSYSPFFG